MIGLVLAFLAGAMFTCWLFLAVATFRAQQLVERLTAQDKATAEPLRRAGRQ